MSSPRNLHRGSTEASPKAPQPPQRPISLSRRASGAKPQTSEERSVRDKIRTSLNTGDVAGAIELLKGALAKEGFGKSVEKASVIPKRDPGEQKRRNRVAGPTTLEPPSPDASAVGVEVSQLIGLLTMSLTKQGDWDSVCRYANVALGTPSWHQQLTEEARADLRLRRGVALSQIAVRVAEPKSGGSASELCTFGEALDLAEEDFNEAAKIRPRDQAVLRGLEHIEFLRKQAAVLTEEGGDASEPKLGLARLRAMDP